MYKYLVFIMIAIILSSCSTPKPLYNDSTIRWEEEPIIAEGRELDEPEQSEITNKVYVTKSGRKFHNDDCKSLTQSKIEMDYNQALKEGYTACSVCNPD